MSTWARPKTRSSRMAYRIDCMSAPGSSRLVPGSGGCGHSAVSPLQTAAARGSERLRASHSYSQMVTSVVTGGPQVVFVLFSGLPSLLGSSAEPCVLELATIMPVIQAAMELEHGGDARVIAIHGQVSQAQSHLRSVASMQRTRQPADVRLVGQPVEGGPAVTRSIAVRHGTIVHSEVRPAPDVACADRHVLGHIPGVETVCVKANSEDTWHSWSHRPASSCRHPGRPTCGCRWPWSKSPSSGRSLSHPHACPRVT